MGIFLIISIAILLLWFFVLMFFYKGKKSEIKIEDNKNPENEEEVKAEKDEYSNNENVDNYQNYADSEVFERKIYIMTNISIILTTLPIILMIVTFPLGFGIAFGDMGNDAIYEVLKMFKPTAIIGFILAVISVFSVIIKGLIISEKTTTRMWIAVILSIMILGTDLFLE